MSPHRLCKRLLCFFKSWYPSSCGVHRGNCTVTHVVYLASLLCKSPDQEGAQSWCTKPAGLQQCTPPFSASIYLKPGAKTRPPRLETHSFSTKHTNKFRLIQRAGGMHPPPPGPFTHTHTTVTPVPLVRECGFCLFCFFFFSLREFFLK